MVSFLDRLFSHHAYLIRTTRSGVDALLENLKDRGLAHNFEHYEKLSIDDAREIKKSATEGGENTISVFFIETLEREASHALLKMIEEPRAGLVFIFCILPSAPILDTITSRLFEIKIEKEIKIKNQEDRTQAQEFLKSDILVRQKQVQRLLDTHDETDAYRARVGLFVRAIIEEVALSHKADTTGKKAHSDFLEPALQFESYLYDRGSSVKSILEWIMLSAPFIK